MTTLLPIVFRELQVAARQDRTYHRRWQTVLVGLGICLWAWFITSYGMSPNQRGRSLFYGLAVVAFAYAGLAGLGSADAISAEKREGTLGLLFLTRLRSLDVIFGKMAAFSLGSVYRLISLLPLLALPLLMGSVAPLEVGRVLVVLLNTVFFSLAGAVLISVLSRESQRAMWGTLLFVLAWCLVPPLLGLIWSRGRGWGGVSPGILWPSPLISFLFAFDSMPRPSSGQFGWSLATVHSLGWVFLILAARILPRCVRPSGSAAGGAFASEQANARTQRRLRSAWENRAFWLELNPYSWRAVHTATLPRMIWFGFVLTALIVGLIASRNSAWLGEAPWLGVIGVFLHTWLKGAVAMESPRCFSSDVRSGALELVLTTPVRPRDLIDGILLGLRLRLQHPVALVLGMDAILFSLPYFFSPAVPPMEWVLVCLGSAAMLVADLWAISWLGMEFGVRWGSTGRASLAAFVCVLVLPCIVFTVALIVLGRGLAVNTFAEFLVLWFAVGAVMNAILGSWARDRIEAQMLALAGSGGLPQRPPPSGAT